MSSRELSAKDYTTLLKEDDAGNLLKTSLYYSFPPDNNRNKVYVKYMNSNIGLNFYYLYTRRQLFLIMKNLTPSLLNYFELIPAGWASKFAVDIDIMAIKYPNLWNKENEIVDAVIGSISNVFKKLGITEKPLVENEHYIVTTSRGDAKQSIHIIVYAWHFESMAYCKIIYYMMLKHIPDEMHVILEKTVYKPNQLFRMVGSCKVGTNRHKIPRNTGKPGFTYVQYKQCLLSYVRKSQLVKLTESYPENEYEDKGSMRVITI